MILAQIPSESGVQTSSGKTPYVAHADDLVLISRYALELSNMLKSLEAAFSTTGLMLNTENSFTISWIVSRKKKQIIYRYDRKFNISNRPPQRIHINSIFNCLGVSFTPNGRKLTDPSKLDEKLKLLDGCCLKPQQKMYTLRVHVLPSCIHQLIMGRFHTVHLKRLDIKVRNFVKKCLHLTHDLPSIAIHTSVCGGGMGVPSLRWMVSMGALRRLNHNSKRTENILRYEG